MKIDFSQELLDRDRTPMAFGPRRGRSGEMEMATLGLVCAASLEQFRPERLSWLDNLRLAKLVNRLVEGGEQNVSTDEVKQLVEAVGQHPMLHIASECVRMLDPETWNQA